MFWWVWITTLQRIFRSITVISFTHWQAHPHPYTTAVYFDQRTGDFCKSFFTHCIQYLLSYIRDQFWSFLYTHLSYAFNFTVVYLCHVMVGIPPPSEVIVGKNRSTRRKTTVRSKRVDSSRVKWGPFTWIPQWCFFKELQLLIRPPLLQCKSTCIAQLSQHSFSKFNATWTLANVKGHASSSMVWKAPLCWSKYTTDNHFHLIFGKIALF